MVAGFLVYRELRAVPKIKEFKSGKKGKGGVEKLNPGESLNFTDGPVPPQPLGSPP
jgi:hypothetical protein